MTKLRRRTPDVGPAGAFGRRVVKRTVARDVESVAFEAERRRIRNVLSVEYSYDELQQIGANMRRDAERSAEIAQMFDELGGGERIEDAYYTVYMWRLAKSRERRRAAPRPVKSLALLEKLRRRAKDYYRRVIADPLRSAERKRKDKARYERRRSDPETLARMNEAARLRASRDKDKRYAAWKNWYARGRAERSPAYLRFLERERARVRRDYQDDERREKRRKASRECMQRKRDRMKREDPDAYRARLDARNAKRTPNRASARFGAPGPKLPRNFSRARARLRNDPEAHRAYREHENEMRRARKPKRSAASLAAENARKLAWAKANRERVNAATRKRRDEHREHAARKAA